MKKRVVFQEKIPDPLKAKEAVYLRGLPRKAKESTPYLGVFFA
jgi:hypothetical protein